MAIFIYKYPTFLKFLPDSPSLSLYQVSLIHSSSSSSSWSSTIQTSESHSEIKACSCVFLSLNGDRHVFVPPAFSDCRCVGAYKANPVPSSFLLRFHFAAFVKELEDMRSSANMMCKATLSQLGCIYCSFISYEEPKKEEWRLRYIRKKWLMFATNSRFSETTPLTQGRKTWNNYTARTNF